MTMRRIFTATVLVLFLLPTVALGAVNDPYYLLQWGLKRIGSATTWASSKGAGEVVAVVDTGVDPNHPDLRGRLVRGYDFVDGDNTPNDRNGHGTLIAGIIAADTGNGIGVASVAPSAKVMPVRVLGADGTGSASAVVDGIDWAVRHGADVINLSLAQESSADNSGSLLRAPAVDRAIKNAARTAVVVIAAGNDPDGGLSQTSYDATTPGVVVVGASTNKDRRAAYSNYGAGLDLLAPGGGTSSDPSEAACVQSTAIVSTWWNPLTQRDGYGGGCGTSMAVAFVSGVAAQLLARGYSNAAAVTRILRTAHDIGPSGRDNGSGYGILDAARALGARAVTPPHRRSTGTVHTAGSTPRATATPSPTAARAPQLPPGEAIVPLQLPASERSGPVTAAAALICLLMLGHGARVLLRAPR
jgi:serine protease